MSDAPLRGQLGHQSGPMPPYGGSGGCSFRASVLGTSRPTARPPSLWPIRVLERAPNRALVGSLPEVGCPMPPYGGIGHPSTVWCWGTSPTAGTDPCCSASSRERGVRLSMVIRAGVVVCLGR